MTNNITLPGLWENIILTADGTIGFPKSDAWGQMVMHLIVVARPPTYKYCMMLKTSHIALLPFVEQEGL